ncbi:hypothetical protein [Lacinutrix himadriensis]|uniref:hypothetical protein n=1 Tax=Lacinutrix himadriensis TaxID=641549 RepID=UPI0006E2D246|nr:hypothetical protein [Lacinutrix himadriensis]
MKAKQTYLKGKSVFIVSILVLVVTILTVYFTGENYNRTVTSNLYFSLAIIGIFLFLFMTYGLYKGIALTDNFPKFKNFKTGNIIAQSGTFPDLRSIEVGDGIVGLIMSILLWIGMTIVVFILLILLEAVFWISIFIILAMLYWVFFRALKLVFSKGEQTKGDLGASASYSIAYTVFYLGWIFGIVYLSALLR